MVGKIGSDLAGWLAADGHHLPVRVYHEDTDFTGSVYHGSYVRFLERGRSDFLRLIGIEHAPLAADGLHFAVSAMTLSFRRAATIDDRIEIVTQVGTLTGARVVLDQVVRRGTETLVTAEVTVALTNRSGRPSRFPQAIRTRLRADLMPG